ncbi:MAG: hypothetical protein IIY02_05525 [Firmicutes bacterium]|nr:hypothetical protein [Bacillota bacterium]
MKKLIAILMMLCLCAFAVGCAAAEEPVTETEVETEVEETATLPTEEEIKNFYDSAYDIYQWFELGKLDVETDSEGMVATYTLSDGNMYGKVADDEITSMADLEFAVYSVFSADIADTLLGYNLYVEEDGVLYELFADRGGDITRGDIIKETVTEVTETSFTYTVTVETIDPETMEVIGSEDINFVAELIDGEWLFTEFCSIY